MFLVGTGESLSGLDLSGLHEIGTVVAVKQSLPDLPHATAYVSVDTRAMIASRPQLCEAAGRMEVYLCVPPELPPEEFCVPGALFLRRRQDRLGLSDDPSVVESGGSSGFAALNVAYLKRARKIVLLGYDYCGLHYCHSRYPHQTRRNNLGWARWSRVFSIAVRQLSEAGVTVVNGSEISTIDAFVKMSPEQAIRSVS